MKLREMTKQIDMLAVFGQPILFKDDVYPSFIKKYRHTKDLPIGFYETFNYEIEKYLNDLLDLEVTFTSDKGTYTEIYITGLRDLFMKIDKQGG